MLQIILKTQPFGRFDWMEEKPESIGLYTSSYGAKGKLPMSHPILVTGAAGGAQGSTGRAVSTLLLEQGIPVRALV
jgi:hypothetical protein